MVTKMHWLQWKMYHSWVAHRKSSSRPNLQRRYGRPQQSWDQVDEYDSRKLHSVKANMRENKGPSLGKIQVKNSSSAQSLRNEIWGQILGGDWKTRAMCARGDAWRLAKNIFKLKETDKEWRLPHPQQKPRGKIICCRFQREHAHVEQERPELSRIGKSKSLEKSDDGGTSQRRGADRRRGNTVCQGIGFIRDSQASRRYTGRSLTRKNLRRSRVFLPLDQWSEATTHQK